MEVKDLYQAQYGVCTTLASKLQSLDRYVFYRRLELVCIIMQFHTPMYCPSQCILIGSLHCHASPGKNEYTAQNCRDLASMYSMEDCN